jgi:2OG-Fe(II) oxygenase superfamily
MGAWTTVALASAAVAVLALAVRHGIVLGNRRRYPVIEVPGFLSQDECAHLIARAEPVLRKSAVVLGGKGRSHHVDRESGTTFLDQRGDPVLADIKRRIAELTGTRADQQERLQVTHYRVDQHYLPHYDSLRSSGMECGEAGDRVATVIIYLNDDYRGGATWFPRIRRRIEPEKGKAVYFRNLTADGEGWDRLSLHAGETVRGGEKWLSNQWIRQHRRYAQGAARAGGQRKRRGRGRRWPGGHALALVEVPARERRASEEAGDGDDGDLLARSPIASRDALGEGDQLAVEELGLVEIGRVPRPRQHEHPGVGEGVRQRLGLGGREDRVALAPHDERRDRAPAQAAGILDGTDRRHRHEARHPFRVRQQVREAEAPAHRRRDDHRAVEAERGQQLLQEVTGIHPSLLRRAEAGQVDGHRVEARSRQDREGAQLLPGAGIEGRAVEQQHRCAPLRTGGAAVDGLARDLHVERRDPLLLRPVALRPGGRRRRERDRDQRPESERRRHRPRASRHVGRDSQPARPRRALDSSSASGAHCEPGTQTGACGASSDATIRRLAPRYRAAPSPPSAVPKVVLASVVVLRPFGPVVVDVRVHVRAAGSQTPWDWRVVTPPFGPVMVWSFSTPPGVRRTAVCEVAVLPLGPVAVASRVWPPSVFCTCTSRLLVWPPGPTRVTSFIRVFEAGS